MAETRKVTGSCHCGAVRYEAMAALDRVTACNCSICSKRGSLLAFAPASAFTLLGGEEALADYQFNKKIVHHLFCRTCGVSPFARGSGPDGSEMVAINVRCLDDIDLDALTVVPFDGKSL